MICEIISKPGERGSGGSRDAFAPGVTYVCGKAFRVELLNLSSPAWHHAAEDMYLTSELSARVRKPYYHLVLSWHEHERPTEEQQLAAMHHLIETLGLDEHQIAIGAHEDTKCAHIHAVVNIVHPVTGKVWSKSNDQMKAEKACREVELRQGWTHDRGRFNFDVIGKDGEATVRLKPDPDGWERKKQARAQGRRKPSPGDIAFLKHHGVQSFNQDIPPALRDRFARIVDASGDWHALHAGLAEIGLHYRKAGSGARVYLLGSEEYAKASVFGQAFSMKKLQARLGPFEDRETNPKKHDKATQKEVAYISGSVSEEDAKKVRSSSFKMTLLRRLYTELHLDAEVAAQIRYVHLDTKPPVISFKDRSSVTDHGKRISTSAVTQTTIKATVAMAKAKGWSAVVPSGPPDYVRGIAIEAARAGLPVRDVPEEVQAMADDILKQTRKKQRRLDREADAALADHLSRGAEREDAIEENRTEQARRAADSILGDQAPAPPRAPGRPPVKARRSAPDASKKDPGGARRIRQRLRDNDRSELEDMKRVDIGVIARLGGWSDVSGTHPDSSDARGVKYRIFQRGDDTIKASLEGDRWLWTSNKSGKAGSVIDLWLHDNPDKTIGHARETFREHLGTTPAPQPATEARRAPERADHTEARRRWEEAPHIGSQRSYAGDRGISRQTLTRHRDQVRSGAFGGIYFAHRNERGDIQGFEQRWETEGRKNTARFARGGRKTVNVLGNPATAKRMVVVEGGLDALALAEIEDRSDTLYVSTGGGFGQRTEDALLRLANGRDLLSGFDNDDAGEAMHAKLAALLPDITRHAPPAGVEGTTIVCKDWLEVLNANRDVLQEDPAGPSEQTGPEIPGM